MLFVQGLSIHGQPQTIVPIRLKSILRKATQNAIFVAGTVLVASTVLPPVAYGGTAEELSTSTTTLITTSTTTTTSTWNSGNGQVELTDPLVVRIGNNNPQILLRHPVLLGSGGGGAVFSMTWMTPNNNNHKKVAVKISWESSAASVQKECTILQIMNQYQVSGVEQCLGSVPYNNNNNNKDPSTTAKKENRRVMIVLEPVLEGPFVNAVTELPIALQGKAVTQIVQTWIQMLAAQVVTTDVQPLIHQETGQVLFIDMTEAQVIGTVGGGEGEGATPTFLELALCRSFCSEMLALIPESLYSVARQTLNQELWALQSTHHVADHSDATSKTANNDDDNNENIKNSQRRSTTSATRTTALLPEIVEILKDQVPFLTRESIELLQ